MAGSLHHPHLHPGSGEPREPDDLYAEPPPWDIGRSQPAILALAEEGAIRGRVLDAGCGTGEHVLMCAGLGLDATGVDLASRALRTAEEKAHERDRTARFLHWDALKLADLHETFDTVLDCGLFHIFVSDDRTAYADSLRAAIRPGGRYFMLCFSNRQSGEWGRVHKLHESRDRGVVRQRMAYRLHRAQHDRHLHRPGRHPGLARRPHQDLNS